MSALPDFTDKERAMRGRTRIIQAIYEFKALQQNIKCVACREEISKQIALQTEGLKEIELAWNL